MRDPYYRPPPRGPEPTGAIDDRPTVAVSRPLVGGRTLLAAVLTVIPGGAPPMEEAVDYRTFFEAAPNGQLVLDPARRIRRANRAAERLFRRNPGELQGRVLADLVVPRSHEALDAVFASLLRDGGAATPVLTEGLGPEGAPIPIEIVVVRLPSAGPIGFGAVVRDLRDPVAGPGAVTSAAPGKYTLAELLMANRLRDLV